MTLTKSDEAHDYTFRDEARPPQLLLQDSDDGQSDQGDDSDNGDGCVDSGENIVKITAEAQQDESVSQESLNEPATDMAENASSKASDDDDVQNGDQPGPAAGNGKSPLKCPDCDETFEK
jgi:hypothetical protein